MHKAGPPAGRPGQPLSGGSQKPKNLAARWMPAAAVPPAAGPDAAFLHSVLPAPPTGETQPPPPPMPKAAPNEPVNLIQNPSMEDLADGAPTHWRPSTFNGSVKFALDSKVAHSGAHSVTITSDAGADAGWSQDV